MTAGNTNKPNRLTSIPLEVLLQITSYLTTPEYGILRLTCASVEATLYSSFTKEFFSKKQFMMARFSLQPLIAISKSRLSDCLEHVIFGLERPITNVQPVSGSDASSTSSNRLYNECLDYTTLVNSGLDVDMLCEAFSNLKTLKTIGMRDFDSTSRYRDYPRNSWKSVSVHISRHPTSQANRFHHAQASRPYTVLLNPANFDLYRSMEYPPTIVKLALE